MISVESNNTIAKTKRSHIATFSFFTFSPYVPAASRRYCSNVHSSTSGIEAVINAWCVDAENRAVGISQLDAGCVDVELAGY